VARSLFRNSAGWAPERWWPDKPIDGFIFLEPAEAGLLTTGNLLSAGGSCNSSWARSEGGEKGGVF